MIIHSYRTKNHIFSHVRPFNFIHFLCNNYVSGFVLPSATPLHTPGDKHYQQDSQVETLFLADHSSSAVRSQLLSGLLDNVHVYAQQGKSSRIHLWPLDDLLQSNEQLNELDPKIVDNLSEFKIPKEGISQGLSNKVVLLYK